MIVLQFSLHRTLSPQASLCSDIGYRFYLDYMITLNLPEINFPELAVCFLYIIISILYEQPGKILPASVSSRCVLTISMKEIPVRKWLPSSSFRYHELTRRRAEGYQVSGLNSFARGMCSETQVQTSSTTYLLRGAFLQPSSSQISDLHHFLISGFCLKKRKAGLVSVKKLSFL